MWKKKTMILGKKLGKKSQGSIAIGIFGFWLIFALILTLYDLSDSPKLNAVSKDSLNESTYNSQVTELGSADQAGFFGTLWNIMSFFLKFIWTFIGLLTFYFPVFESQNMTFIIGSILLIVKIASWWILLRFWV